MSSESVATANARLTGRSDADFAAVARKALEAMLPVIEQFEFGKYDLGHDCEAEAFIHSSEERFQSPVPRNTIVEVARLVIVKRQNLVKYEGDEEVCDSDYIFMDEGEGKQPESWMRNDSVTIVVDDFGLTDDMLLTAILRRVKKALMLLDDTYDDVADTLEDVIVDKSLSAIDDD